MQQTVKQFKLIMTTLIITAVIGILASLVIVQKAHAQEINPTPGTYSYGSTSEFSPYSTLSQGSSNSLAPTGQGQAIGYIAIAVLLIIAGGTTYALIRKRMNQTKTN